MADQNIWLQVDKLLRERLNSLCICIAPAIVDPNIMAILPAEFLKPLLKYRRYPCEHRHRFQRLPLGHQVAVSDRAAVHAPQTATSPPPATNDRDNSRRLIASPEAEDKAS